MKLKIYYFSGTGNSLSVARKISESVEGSELINIAKLDLTQKTEGEAMGIVCPIYMYNTPKIVTRFIASITKVDYLFMVYAGAGGLGTGIKSTFKLFKENDLHLSALFNLKMPDNYTPYGVPSAEKIKNLLSKVDSDVNRIVSIVKEKGTHIDANNTTLLKSHVFPGLLYQLGYKMIPQMDKQFVVEDSCNGCYICKQVCPVDNISDEGEQPQWLNHCEQCLACMHWCPKTCIQIKEKTIGIDRYHHPDVKVKDIIGK